MSRFMGTHDLPESSMINWISDDMSYLKTLPQRSKDKKNGIYSPLKQAHDARLLIVFGHAMIEGFTSYVATRVNMPYDTKTIELIKHLCYPPEFLTVDSLDRLAALLDGIRELRHIIAHGLTDAIGRRMDQKIGRITNAGLPIDPRQLTEEHFKVSLEALANVTNILGAGLVNYNDPK